MTAADVTYFPGDTHPNLKGTIQWPGLMELTNATAAIHVGPYSAAALPFYGAVALSNIIESATGSSFDWEYNTGSSDTVEGSYRVLIRVTFENGEIETIVCGEVDVTDFQ